MIVERLREKGRKVRIGVCIWILCCQSVSSSVACGESLNQSGPLAGFSSRDACLLLFQNVGGLALQRALLLSFLGPFMASAFRSADLTGVLSRRLLRAYCIVSTSDILSTAFPNTSPCIVAEEIEGTPR